MPNGLIQLLNLRRGGIDLADGGGEIGAVGGGDGPHLLRSLLERRSQLAGCGKYGGLSGSAGRLRAPSRECLVQITQSRRNTTRAGHIEGILKGLERGLQLIVLTRQGGLLAYGRFRILIAGTLWLSGRHSAS